MSISVNTSRLARFSGTATATTGITSGSFTPANNSLLVAVVTNDSGVGAGNNFSSIVGTSTGLTWTQRIFRASAVGGYCAILTCPITTGAAMTAQFTAVDDGFIGNTLRMSVKIYEVTGHAASPIGVSSGAIDNLTNNITPALGTATGSGSGGRFFYGGVEWEQRGLPTSTDTEDAADYAGAISVESVIKAADHAAGSGAQTGSLDAFGSSSARWSWVSLEILAAGSGTAITGTGAVTSSISTVAGSGIKAAGATGNPTITRPTVAGTAIKGSIGSGAVSLPKIPVVSSTTGTATTGSGAPVAGISTIAGVGLRGVLDAPGAIDLSYSGILAIAGVGTLGTAQEGTGAVTAPPATIAGTAAKGRTTTGALLSSVSTLAGIAFIGRALTGTGALVSSRSIASGTSSFGHTGTGAVVSLLPVVTGTGTGAGVPAPGGSGGGNHTRSRGRRSAHGRGAHG